MPPKRSRDSLARPLIPTVGVLTSRSTHRSTEETRRRRLRATFEEVPELYYAARPLYPRQVFDDLVELTSLDAGSRVLEIGPGTGQATLPSRSCGHRSRSGSRRLAEGLTRSSRTPRFTGIELLDTASGHRAMPEAQRQALYSRIRERIGDRKVSKTLQAILNVARRL